MQHVDALSRNPARDIKTSRAIAAMTDNWKHSVQAGDNDIQKIVRSIENMDRESMETNTSWKQAAYSEE